MKLVENNTKYGLAQRNLELQLWGAAVVKLKGCLVDSNGFYLLKDLIELPAIIAFSTSSNFWVWG